MFSYLVRVLQFTRLIIIFIISSSAFVANADTKKLKFGWEFNLEIDKMTDLNTSYISKRSKSNDGYLRAQCTVITEISKKDKSIIRMGIVYKWRPSSGGLIEEVRNRFDKNPPKKILYFTISDGWIVLNWLDTRPFATSATTADRLILEARTVTERLITDEFELIGLNEALNYANKAAPCKEEVFKGGRYCTFTGQDIVCQD